jgi:hypothetical protein
MTKEVYNRGNSLSTLQQRVVESSGKIALLSIEHLKEQLGVTELIRISAGDYPEPELLGQRVLHVNLPITYSRLNRIAALPRIIKPGYFKPPVEEQPVLSYQSIWKASVVDFIDHVTYEALPADMFAGMIIGGANNAEELKRLVLRRDGPSLPSTSEAEILGQGLSLTWLSLRELVSLS